MQKEIKMERVDLVSLKIKGQKFLLKPEEIAILKEAIRNTETSANFSVCVNIRNAVCQALGIKDPEILHLKTRARVISEPRQICSYLMDRENIPRGEIARFFGFNRTAVDHGARAITNRLVTDKKLSASVARILQAQF